MWTKNFFVAVFFCSFSVELSHSNLIKYELLQEKNYYKTDSSNPLILELQENLKAINNSVTDGNLWVVLAAGSEGWFNYRHQADICHAYQIVRQHGVPDEQIVVFMKDDIAYNEMNPYQGLIINRPNGPNVYPGVPKDYTDVNLNASIFLDVLGGKKITVGSRKTLKTGPNDRIFIYFADHGGPGVSLFGKGLLHATNLTDTIIQMHEDTKFKEMVIYWESCHSGSMFQNLLPNNINVYALTASSPKEESYACYEDKHIRNYLGDCFSVHWMEDADKENLNGETLLTQYLITKYETNTSHVEQWGSNLKMDHEKVGDFLGSGNGGEPKYFDISKSQTHSVGFMRPVRQSDVILAIHKMKLKDAKDSYETERAKKSLYQLKSKRSALTETLDKILSTAIKIDHKSLKRADNPTPLFFGKRSEAYPTTRAILEKCFYPIVKLFNENCFELTCNDYAIYQVKQFLPLCKAGIAVDSLRKSMAVHCHFEKHICGID